MQDIDSMDMLGFLKMRVWKAKRDDVKKHAPKPKKKQFIDQVWPGMQSK